MESEVWPVSGATQFLGGSIVGNPFPGLDNLDLLLCLKQLDLHTKSVEVLDDEGALHPGQSHANPPDGLDPVVVG